MEILNKYNEDKLNTLENRVRAGISKLNNETNLSWKELVDVLKLDIHPDEFRKRAYGYQEYEYVHMNALRNGCTKEEINLLNDKLMELQKERTKINDMRNHVNRKLRDVARRENMFELARELVFHMDNQYPLIKEVDVTNDGTNEGILMLSDWHIGIEINNSWNVFNTEVLFERTALLTYNAIQHCQSFQHGSF